MQTNIWTVLLPVIVGGAIGAVFPLINQVLSYQQQKKRAIWDRRIDKIFELEENAGYLTEYLAGHKSIAPVKEELIDRIRKIDVVLGSLLRYTDIVQPIRDFTMSANWILYNERKFDTQDEYEKAIKEIDERFLALTKACDKLLR